MDRTPSKQVLLIADANPEDVKVLKTILASDCDIKVAADGEEAIRLASIADAPGLILIGELPAAFDMYEVCRQLKTGKTTKDIPGILDNREMNRKLPGPLEVLV